MKYPELASRWWIAFAAFLLLFLVPGPSRSPFSGIPLSSQAHLVLAGVLTLALAGALFPARQPARWRWTALLLVLTAVKIGVTSLTLQTGWRAEYRTHQMTSDGTASLELEQVRFFHRGVRTYRIDRRIAFDGINFGLHYVNDWPRPTAVLTKTPRDHAQPLEVTWHAVLPASPEPAEVTMTANGDVTLVLDGETLLDAHDPAGLVARAPPSARPRTIDIHYRKPADVRPAITVDLGSLEVTPEPVAPDAVSRSRWAARGVLLTGLAGLAVLLLAFFDGRGRVTRFLLEDIWRRPDRVAVVAFFVCFALLGVSRTIPSRHATLPIGFGDDPIAYEGGARRVLFNGLLMTADDGTEAPYYFYPLYSYALAGAHALLGEDFGTIIFFNYLCIAVLGLLLWGLLHLHLRAGSTVLALALFALLCHYHGLVASHTAFSDNLFLPMVFLVLVTCVKALRDGSLGWVFVSGVLAALGGATRPSLMFYAPVFCAALWLCWAKGPSWKGLAAGSVFGVGFVAGLAPFTIRNWVVSGRFVLIIASYIMLPVFLFAPGEPPPPDIGARSATMAGAVDLFLETYARDPLHYTWVEIRKVLFTLGFTQFGHAGVAAPRYFVIFPLLFAAAVWAGRLPRSVQVVLFAFTLSHLVAMVVAAPWTYGYKTIVPFHFALFAGAAFLLPRVGDVPVRAGLLRPARPPGTAPTVTVVLPTYNEKDSIRQAILDFFATGAVTEVLVVNNNAAPGTSEEVAGTGAREVFETRQGYGAAIRRGLHEAQGDLIVVCEPDGTFVARDVHKLLAYVDDFDIVYGSRTSQQLVWDGANMGHFLRWGNWAVAKYMEILFNATSLTDVGCTYRVLWRSAADDLRDHFRIEGSQFGPEMMALSLRRGHRVVQVPVNYRPRVGESAVTGDMTKAFRLGLQMIWLITRHRVEVALASPTTDAPAPEAAPWHV